MATGARTLAELVARRAQTEPDREALVGSTLRYTWSEYDAAVARLAAFLRVSGVATGDRVAVAMPKDAASFVAIHAVLRAGAIVVPIDPMAPPSVAATTMQDAAVSGVFADQRLIDATEPWSIDGLPLKVVIAPGAPSDERVVAWADALEAGHGVDLGRPAPDDPAYIIYTSGSTGRPKGIVHTHRSALAYAERAVRHHGLTERDLVAGMSPLHFDMSTLELYAAPLCGASVVVFGEGHLRFPASFTQRCESERTTVWYTVPPFLRQVVERGATDQRDLSSVRLVMYAGESYTDDGVRALFAALPGIEVKNVYGPAEVNECTNHLVELDALSGEIPIGRPWDGVDCIVVDDSGAPVPPGQQGELLVSAPTLMAGYWNRPDLTAASLVARSDGPDWYRTGDLVRADDDGLLWFAGRRDHQVKVRGIRIELEAVEAALTDAPGVLHAVAVPVGDGAVSHVTGVVVLRDGADLDEVAIRAHCRARLAAVAVPRAIIAVPALPSTPTGKIDRRSVRVAFAGGATNEDNGGGMS